MILLPVALLVFVRLALQYVTVARFAVPPPGAGCGSGTP